MQQSLPVSSWFETIHAKLREYPVWLVDSCLYGAVGLIAGFLFKNFGRYLLFALIGIIVLLWLLSRLDLIVVNTYQIKTFLGVGSINTLDEGCRAYIEYVRNHIVGCIAFLVGFFFGWKLG